jgi:hypothetical protein
MNSNKLNLLWLLIAFAAGALVCHILSTQRRLICANAGFDSRLARIEAREMQIETQKTKRRSRLVWVGYILQFAGLVCQVLGKLRLW